MKTEFSDASRSVLVLGSSSHNAPNVVSIEWGEQVPHFPTYNSVILNLTPFQDEASLDKIEWAHLPSAAWFAKLLIDGAEILAIIDPCQWEQTQDSQSGRKGRRPVYEFGTDPIALFHAARSPMWWFPGHIEFTRQKSKPAKVFINAFEAYFDRVRETTFIVDPVAIDGRSYSTQYGKTEVEIWSDLLTHSGRLEEREPQLPEGWSSLPTHQGEHLKIHWEVTAIAANEQGQYIAIGAAFSTSRIPRLLSGDFKHLMFPESGTCYLLPPPTEIPVSDGIDILLASVLDISIRSPKPNWASMYSMPGQDKLQRELEDRQRTLSVAQEDRVQIQATLDAFTRPLELLYGTEAALEHLVRSIFEELGAEAKEPDSSRKGKEDGSIRLGQDVGVLEIKSHVRKGFSLREMRQLGQWVEDYYESTGLEAKGVFVGNHQAVIEPGKRSKPFPDNALKYAINRGFCLLTTVDLFEAVCAVRSGKIDASAVLKSVFRTVGEWTLADVPSK